MAHTENSKARFRLAEKRGVAGDMSPLIAETGQPRKCPLTHQSFLSQEQQLNLANCHIIPLRYIRFALPMMLMISGAIIYVYCQQHRQTNPQYSRYLVPLPVARVCITTLGCPEFHRFRTKKKAEALEGEFCHFRFRQFLHTMNSTRASYYVLFQEAKTVETDKKIKTLTN